MWQDDSLVQPPFHNIGTLLLKVKEIPDNRDSLSLNCGQPLFKNTADRQRNQSPAVFSLDRHAQNGWIRFIKHLLASEGTSEIVDMEV